MARTESVDYYALLGVSPQASDEDIRHAYRQLAKRWHPDGYRAASDEVRDQAERRMRLLTEAYRVLGDAQRRADYDAERFTRPDSNQHLTQGIPFEGGGMAPIPGMRMSRTWQPETADENGLSTFIGLVSGIIALIALLGIRGGMGGPGSLIALLIMLAAGSVALLSFARQGPVNRFAHTAAQTIIKEDFTWDDAQSAFGDEPATGSEPADAVLSTSGEAGDAAAQPADHAVGPDDFADLIHAVIASLPHEFADELRNVAIVIEQEPGYLLLRQLRARPGGPVTSGTLLLGLYEGVPLTAQGASGAVAPARITIFRGPIERYCFYDPIRIRHQVRATLLHEIAHAFGMDHDAMPLWVKA